MEHNTPFDLFSSLNFIFIKNLMETQLHVLLYA